MRQGEIAAALRTLAQGVGFWRSDDELIRALNGELKTLRDCWHIDTGNGPSAARAIVQVNLKAHIERLEPRPAHQSLFPDERRDQYRHAVKVSFNLMNDLALKSADLTRRQAWLEQDERGEVYKIRKKSCQRDFDHAIENIARQVLAGGYAPLSAPLEVAHMDLLSAEVNENSSSTNAAKPTAHSEASADHQHRAALSARAIRAREAEFNDYVIRRRLHDEFAQAIESGARVIALVGHKGMGRARLAEALVSIYSSDREVIRVSFNGLQISTRYFLSTLLKLRIITEWAVQHEHNESDAATLFALLVNHQRAPEYLVFETSWCSALPQNLGDLTNARSRFIITCLPGFQLPRYAHVINVGSLEDEEAEALLTSKAPDVSKGDVRKLVSELHGYPPAILYTADLLTRRTLPVESVLQILRCRPDIFYANAPLPDGVTTESVAHQILRTVEDKDLLARHLLECIVFLERAYDVDLAFIVGYARQLTEKSQYQEFIIRTALDALVSLQIIVLRGKLIHLNLPLRATLYQVVRPKIWTVALGVLQLYRHDARRIMAFYPAMSTDNFVRSPGLYYYATLHAFDILAEAIKSDALQPPEVSDDDLRDMQTLHDKLKQILKGDGEWIKSAKSGEWQTQTWTIDIESGTWE
jgi:hypothetical protein